VKNSIILFRFYKDFDVAKERIKILKYFNPELPVYGLFGGNSEDFETAAGILEDSMEGIWNFKPDKNPRWKWFHTDLMQKAWFRDAGHKIDFDFLFSYEYDLLTADSLFKIYPEINDETLALAAVELLDKVEDRWTWTSKEPFKSKFAQFSEYMNENYGVGRQKYVCLGPGPLLSRKFIEKFAQTQDIDLVHEEVTYPAYAEAFGFKLMDNGLHPGFYKGSEAEKRLFNCNGIEPSLDEIYGQLELPSGERCFHPVKAQVPLEEIIYHLAPKTSVK